MRVEVDQEYGRLVAVLPDEVAIPTDAIISDA